MHAEIENSFKRIKKIWEFAGECHKGQKYGKHDYTYHLRMVAENAGKMALNLCDEAGALNETKIWFLDKVIAISALHDVLEDCSENVCIEEDIELTVREVFLVDKDVNDIMKSLILLCNKNEDYEDYLLSIASSDSCYAKLVKKADILANLTQSVFDRDSNRALMYSSRIMMFHEMLINPHYIRRGKKW